MKESELNQELDELVRECLRLDLRGYPVDLLLVIKEQRDNQVKLFVEHSYDPDSEGIENIK